MIAPRSKISPPQTPHGSRRSSAPARQASRAGQSRQNAFACSSSAGVSANQRSRRAPGRARRRGTAWTAGRAARSRAGRSRDGPAIRSVRRTAGQHLGSPPYRRRRRSSSSYCVVGLEGGKTTRPRSPNGSRGLEEPVAERVSEVSSRWAACLASIEHVRQPSSQNAGLSTRWRRHTVAAEPVVNCGSSVTDRIRVRRHRDGAATAKRRRTRGRPSAWW